MTLRFLVLALVLLTTFPAKADPAHSKAGPRLALHLLHGQRATRAERPLTLVSIRTRPPLEQPDTCVGPVCLATVAPADLEAFLADPDLLLADLPGRFRPRLDVAGPLAGAPQARQRYGLSGQGVLVAVIDTGLDWSHPDFIDPAGRTRVAWLLDQGRPPAGLYPELEAIGQGAVFAARDLQQVIDGQGGPAVGAGFDPIGHGTHVAGIAAGDDPVYTGVAPRASLVVVKAIDADLTGFAEDRLLAGLAFVRQVAIDEGRPVALNLSLGTQLGAHDGSEPIELALEALATGLNPPCAVAVAAGNEGQLDLHARGALRADGHRLGFEVVLAQTDPPAVDRPARVVIDVWVDGPGRVDLSVLTPSGWRSDPVGQLSGTFSETTWSPDGQIGLTAAPLPHPINGLHRLTVELLGRAGQPLSTGTWILEMSGQANRVDAWIGEWDLLGGPTPRFASWIDPGELVGPPATARSVFAVGASIARTRWAGADGAEHQLAGQITGQLADFSVRGPTRDGRLKPELAAPGQVVAAALSADADPRSPASIFYAGGSLRKVLPDGLHAVASGTSMAAPFATGLLALAFELEPQATGEQLHARLLVRTTVDEQTGQMLFEPGWGFGKLDALSQLAPIASGPPAALDPAQSLCGLARDWLPADPLQLALVAAVPRSAGAAPLGPGLAVRIEAPNPALFAGPVIDHGNGLYTRALTGSGRRGHPIQVTCSLAGLPFEAQPELLLAASADEAHHGGVTGGAGACAQVGTSALAPAWLLVVLGWLSLRRRLARPFSESSRSSSRNCTRRKPKRPRTG